MPKNLLREEIRCRVITYLDMNEGYLNVIGKVLHFLHHIKKYSFLGHFVICILLTSLKYELFHVPLQVYRSVGRDGKFQGSWNQQDKIFHSSRVDGQFRKL